MKIVIK